VECDQCDQWSDIYSVAILDQARHQESSEKLARHSSAQTGAKAPHFVAAKSIAMPPKFIQFNNTEIYEDMLTLEEFEAQRAAVEELPSVTLEIFMGKWAVYLIDGMEITKYEVLRTSTTVGEPCPIDSVHEDIVRHLYPEEPHPPDVIPIVVGKSGEEKAEAEQMAAQERKDFEEEKAKKEDEGDNYYLDYLAEIDGRLSKYVDKVNKQKAEEKSKLAAERHRLGMAAMAEQDGGTASESSASTAQLSEPLVPEVIGASR
jgi:hypothetical protein